MTPAELMTDHFERIHELFADVVDGLPVEDARARPDGGNSITWLLWHAARIQDDHVAGLSGEEQSWAAWRSASTSPSTTGTTDTGTPRTRSTACGSTTSPCWSEYQDAVHEQTLAYLRGADETELDRVVDERWDPPVTAGARLVSIVGDELQHLGQAAYVKGRLGSS